MKFMSGQAYDRNVSHRRAFWGLPKSKKYKRRITIISNVLKVRDSRTLLIFQFIGMTTEANGSRVPWGRLP